MKKLIGFLVLCAACVLVFSSCSDDDNDVALQKEQIVGTWDIFMITQDGEETYLNGGYYLSINEDNSYETLLYSDYRSGTYKIEGSTMVGTTTDGVTENYRFVDFDGEYSYVDYSNSEGDSYRLGLRLR